MVEMNETANILNNCTANGLIVLDEIGRVQVPMMDRALPGLWWSICMVRVKWDPRLFLPHIIMS